MNYNMHTYKNITINHLKTTPFKSTKIRVAFMAPLEEQKSTLRAILPYIMRAGSEKYPSRKDVSVKVNDMYSSKFNVGVSKKGLTHHIIFELSIINDSYTLFQESLFKEGLDFLHEMIYNPLLKVDSYKEEYRLMTEYYQSIYADKMQYAIKKLQEAMFEEEPYRISALGDMETLEKITYQDVIDEYHSMITKDQVHITVVGDIQFDETIEKVKSLFKGHDHLASFELIEKIDLVRKPRTINIKQDVEQAKLVLGYRMPIYYKEEGYYEAILFDMLFGGSAESLLFKTLREELGLVYSVQSSYNPYKGVFFVYMGINKEEYQRVLDALETLINHVIQKEYSDEDLDIAKKQYTNSLIQSYDSINGLAYKIEHSSMYQTDIDMDKTLKTISKIDKEGIRQAARTLQLDTICFLEGDQDA